MEEAKSPCWVRNVAAGGPLSRLATPGQVCPPVQNKEAARRASVLASGDSPSPELRLQEPTPRSETLQPTSPGVSARGAGYRRRNGDHRIPRPETPASSSSSRSAGRPLVQGQGATRFPRSPGRTKRVSLVWPRAALGSEVGGNRRQTEAGEGKDQGSDSDPGVRLRAAASARGSRARRAGFLRARPALRSGRAAARPRSQDSGPARPASVCLSLLSCGAQAPAPLFLEPWVSWAATHLLEAQSLILG